MILAAVGLLREARIVEGPAVRAVAGGGRTDLLLQRLEAAAEGAEAVLSIGIGGALAPDLQVGGTVIAHEVALQDGQRLAADPAWADRLAQAVPEARRGLVFGSGAMILQAADKARLHAATGALLADMESHAAARFAVGRGLPFAAVRVVSDAASASLPRAVAKGLKPDGNMNLWGVLAALAADPRQLPGLMRAGKEAEAAFTALAAIAPRLRA